MNVFAMLVGALLLVGASTPPISLGPTLRCDGAACRPVNLGDLHPEDGNLTLARDVTVDRSLAGTRPLVVVISALASAEVRWNGKVIGYNGRPGQDMAHESPGRLFATVQVPAGAVRPGVNRVSVRLTSNYLWLPVRNHVYAFIVTSDGLGQLPELPYYLPSLLVAGALAASLAYFGFAAWADRPNPLLTAPAAIAGFGLVQLGIETLRVFVNYPYPWHIARVLAIALCAASIGTLLARYAAARFAPQRRNAATLTAAVVIAAGWIVIPSFDPKALWAMLIGLLALAGFASAAAVRGRRDGIVAAVAAIASLALLAVHRLQFLDRGWYLCLSVGLLLLVVEQVRLHIRSRRGSEADQRRAETLEHRLTRLANASSELVIVREGSRTHRIREDDIVHIRAADDYCELHLADGRTVLATHSLARVLEDLSDRFLRVHRSHAVNRSHVVSVTLRGSRSVVTLRDGGVVPVGRSYRAGAETLIAPG